MAVERVGAHEVMENASAATAMGHPRKVVMAPIAVWMWSPPNASPDGPPPGPPLPDQHRRQDYSKISNDLGCAAPALTE